MAVYNPYDQVIFDDPAYLTDADKVKEQLQEETRGIADIIARTAGPIAGLITDPEAYQQTLDQEQRNKQILESLDITNRQLNRDEMERAKAAGYDPLTPGQALGKIPGFMYSDLVKGSQNIRAGIDYYDLPDNERMGVAMGIIDITDIALLPAVFKKLATLGVKKFGKTNLKTMAQDPELQKQFPVETQEILTITGGGFTPAGVMREADMGPKSVSFRKFSPYDFKKLNKTIKDIKSGKLKPNQGPNKYGLDKNRTNELLRQSPDTNFDYTQLEFPIEELQSLIPRQANFIEAGKYLENLKGKKTFKELFEEGFTRDSIDQARKKNPELTEKIIFSKFSTPGDRLRSLTTIMNKNKKELGLTKTAKMMGDDREEAVLFDGLFRSLEPENLGLSPDVDPKLFGEKFIDFMKGIDWKKQFAEDLDTIKVLDKQRIQGDKIIKEMFNDYKKRFPKQFKNLNVNDFKLQISHNFPLRTVKGQFQGVGGLKGSSRLSFARTNILSHQEIESSFKEIINAANEQGGKLTPIQQEALNLLDKRAKKLGTVAYGKILPEGLEGDEFIKVGIEEQPGLISLIESLENHFKQISKQKNYKPKKVEPKGGPTNLASGFIDEDIPVEIIDDLKMKKGGEVKPVRMAMGGDPLQNINQQQFSPDPAVDQDYFQEAVDSGNLQAANLLNLFKVFKKPKAMATPSNVKQIEEARDPIPAPTGSQEIAPLPAGRQDFFFKSFFLDQLNSQNAPKASTPQGWREFLIKGRKVPEAEMMDTGILQYLEDTEKFFPNKKITKQDLESLYDMSPLGNLEVRVKESTRRDPAETFVPGSTGRDLLDFDADQGRARHKGAGSAKIDEAADEYFEVVVNVPQLPGQEKVFVNSGHYQEPNVLGFTRVGTYKNADNQKVAVIQEMQTDMLTEVRKEQERLFAMVNALKRQRADLVNQVEQARNLGPGNVDYATNKLRQFDQKYPESLLNDLAQDNLIQPFPNIVAKELIPEKTRNLNAIQDDINKLSMANVEQYTDPAYKTKIFDLAQEQTKILDDLMSMNRSSNYQEKLKDFKVPSTSNREELQRIGETDTYLPSGYNMKTLESFPPIPFNKQADYVDLLIKSTIKAAKQKDIDRVAIMPADIGANPRWGKSSDEAKKKFQNLYDKVGVQQLKNIAKKYDGTLNVEKIIDSSKTNRGVTFLNKNPDGEFQILKQIETRKEISDADRDKYYDEEITRIASGVNEPGTIVLTREIAPGQMMDYYLVEGRGDATDVGYRMIPLKEGESADDALIKIMEYNPSAIDMYTISFDPSKLEEPMYLFKKKSGGTIDKDSLVSITDIYGEYGR